MPAGIERPGRSTALVEIKSVTRVDERDVRLLKKFKEDFPDAETFCLSQDPIKKIVNGVLALPWREGIIELGI